MFNKLKDLVIIGAGDFARKIIRLAQSTQQFNILGYTNPESMGSFWGVGYIGTDALLEGLILSQPGCGTAIGFAGNLKLWQYREEMIKRLKKLKFDFPKIIASDAWIEENVEISEGVIIFNRAMVDFNVRIGAFSVINLMALIGHDVTIGKNSVVSPMAIVGGGVRIGNECFIGMNATVNPYVKISDNVIIGAGSVVLRDCPEKGTYVGNPAIRLERK